MELDLSAGVAIRKSRTVAVSGEFWRQPESFGPEVDRFVLDSALPDGRLGRWSYVGGEPSAVLTGRRRADADAGLDLELLVRREPGGARPARPRCSHWRGDPFAALRALLAAYRPGSPAGGDPVAARIAPPFAGGLVGWFGYGLAWTVESLPARSAPADDEPPELLFMLVDEVLARDHRTGVTTLTLTGRGRDAAAAARDLAGRDAAWARHLATAAPAAPGSRAAAGAADGTGPALDGGSGDVPADVSLADRIPFDLAGVSAAWGADAYRAAVTRCREHILAGDAFEICLTQQLAAPLPTDPWRLYAALRAANPAPFAAFLRAGRHFVAGASPERFLSVDATGRLESRPIKGTRPRGATPAADAALRDELATAVKDAAENTMIVDLVRSDLGRVAQVGSVQVPELRVVETYATVHQLVSTVTAQLRPDRDALDAVRACFPPGSMTGAPKVEAMTIIANLEPAPRGVYAGALGWLGWDGAADLSVVIRTFVGTLAGAAELRAPVGPEDKGRVTFGVGGAVTADSDPDAEYRESLDKARALLVALRRAAAATAAAAPDTTQGETR